jgi:hypothetical protein
MPKAYLKKADRIAKAAEEKALITLQKVCDSADATPDAQQRAAEIILGNVRIDSIRKELAQQIKSQRTAGRECKRLSSELFTATTKVSELEIQLSDVRKERDSVKADSLRVGSELVKAREAASAAQSQVTQMRNQLETRDAEASKLTLSLKALVSKITSDDEFIATLFFESGQELSADLFIALGWTQEKVDQWSAWHRTVKDTATERLVELLHRPNCVCKQENNLKVLSDSDAEFFRALLRFRKVDANAEINKLVGVHREDWYRRNRVSFGEPPLSVRQITPIAGSGFDAWGARLD